MGQISSEQIEQARQANVWTLGKQVLYDLCVKYPDHQLEEAIIAKVWLIGRSHSAAIERRKNEDQLRSDSFYEDKVVPALRESELDNYLDSLQQYQQIDRQSLPEILHTHGYLTKLFYDLTQRNNRSLASKYLHFHYPNLFFIYDNRAYTAIGKYYPRERVSNEDLAVNYDYDYRRFCVLMLKLRDAINDVYGIFLTPQEMDNLLLAGSF